MAAQKRAVRVGVAAIIPDAQGRVLTGRRKGSTGSGRWAFPGGHQEFGESYFQCAEREVLEETGLDVRALTTVALTNDVFQDEGLHYVTIHVKCKKLNPDQEPKVLEPNKCEGWQWTTWAELREILGKPDGHNQLFLPIVNLLLENSDIERTIDSGQSLQ
ncbi:hypothetical protein VTK73DRAFT_10150 [Phialemonium thermophilum]|uniref:Nudix hydrolase domain-containing protein n=1 Tax=Phialemonium thermophilum TaxID=223376 RepID=A0ABR3XHA4_9PEZI